MGWGLTFVQRHAFARPLQTVRLLARQLSACVGARRDGIEAFRPGGLVVVASASKRDVIQAHASEIHRVQTRPRQVRTFERHNFQPRVRENGLGVAENRSIKPIGQLCHRSFASGPTQR